MPGKDPALIKWRVLLIASNFNLNEFLKKLASFTLWTNRCFTTMSPIRQPRPEFGLGFQVNALTSCFPLLARHRLPGAPRLLFFFFITLKPRVE